MLGRPPTARAAAVSASNAACSSRVALTPAARRTALRSHCSPNTSNRPPTATRSASIGSAVSAGPSPATTIASRPPAAPTPYSAEDQLLVEPTASTIVSASTASTALASITDRASPISVPDMSSVCRPAGQRFRDRHHGRVSIGPGYRFRPEKEQPPLLDPARTRDPRRVVGLFARYRWRLAAVIGLIVFSSALSMISPFLLRSV